MKLDYTPITEAEDQARGVMAPGEYIFTVIAIETKPSQAGNTMLVVDLEVKDFGGFKHHVKDWVVICEPMKWKLRHFANSCGLIEQYENKTLEDIDFVGKVGCVKIGVSDYEKDGEMRKMNRVIDYLKPTAELVQLQKTGTDNQAHDDFNDDIKF